MNEPHTTKLARDQGEAMDRVVWSFISALQEFDAETLTAVVRRAEAVNPAGWLPAAIREYLGAWRDVSVSAGEPPTP